MLRIDGIEAVWNPLVHGELLYICEGKANGELGFQSGAVGRILTVRVLGGTPELPSNWLALARVKNAAC
jgi:hypothetical protein